MALSAVALALTALLARQYTMPMNHGVCTYFHDSAVEDVLETCLIAHNLTHITPELTNHIRSVIRTNLELDASRHPYMHRKGSKGSSSSSKRSSKGSRAAKAAKTQRRQDAEEREDMHPNKCIGGISLLYRGF
jgi:hypothetical protein